MTVAPIIIFAYNRPEHFNETVQALKRNDLARESDLFIYCDGLKDNSSDECVRSVSLVRTLAHSVDGFRTVTVVERETNLGLAANIVGAVTEIVGRYGTVITLEDDVVVSEGFLEYMNTALDVYKDDTSVMHISAYMWPHRHFLPRTFFYPVPYPGGGWATWARAWAEYNDNASELYDQWNGRWAEFDLFGGDYLSSQLIKNYNGIIKTWFVKWHAVMLQHGAMTLYPGRSLTNNIGFDDSATNCYATNKFDIKHLAKHVKVKHKPVRPNKLAAREIYAFYQGRWYNKRRRTVLLNRIKKKLIGRK